MDYTQLRTTLTLFCLLTTNHQLQAANYYRPAQQGSESLYSPLTSFLSYSLDTLQLPDNFNSSDFREHANQVFEHLRHPGRAIDNEGGFNRFVNRQIAPIDSEHSNDSYSALPNYALHLLGGGMVYRRDLEYFRAHDAAYPTTYAVSLAMTAEIIQEIYEKGTTTDEDEVADVYLFRPLGILLFHQDEVADYVMETLDPAIWPYLVSFDVTQDHIINAGLSYVYRPPATAFGDNRLFIFTGLNNLIGLSHRINGLDSLSWGIGASTQRIDFTLDKQAELEASLGLFYDRDKSLLWSLVLKDTGGTRVRFNMFPGTFNNFSHFGFFLSESEQQRWSAGLHYRLPLGVGFSTD